MQRSDQELIHNYLEGDRSAVAEVDRWLVQAASSYRRRLAGYWEDTLQDVRLELTRLLRSGAFRGDSSLKTYLWRVVSHACLDRIRAASRRRFDEVEEVEKSGVLSLPPPQGARHEQQDLLLRVLTQCSEECQELWRMLYAGLSYREMSQRLNVAEGTLRVRVLRCRRRAVQLREALEGDGDPDLQS
jgi:RNA polymerase sigma-70 factor (ECF subfamily)